MKRGGELGKVIGEVNSWRDLIQIFVGSCHPFPPSRFITRDCSSVAGKLYRQFVQPVTSEFSKAPPAFRFDVQSLFPILFESKQGFESRSLFENIERK